MFCRVANTDLFVLEAFAGGNSFDARIGIYLDGHQGDTLAAPPDWSAAGWILWSTTQDNWAVLLALLAAEPSSRAAGKLSFFDSRARLYDQLDYSSGTLRAGQAIRWRPSETPLQGDQTALLFAVDSRARALGTAIELAPNGRRHLLRISDEDGPFENDFALTSPISIPFEGELRGTIRATVELNESQLQELGVSLRYARAAANPNANDDGEATYTLERSRFPIFSVGSTAMRFELVADLTDIFNQDRSHLAVATEIPSYFETVLGHPVSLAPKEGARLVADRSPGSIFEDGSAFRDRIYFSPEGAFELVVDESAPGHWPETHSLVLGTSTSEYVTFRPRRKDHSGDLIVFHAHMPATELSSLPGAARGIQGTASAEILSPVATTSWISFAPGASGLVDDGPALVSQPAELELFADAAGAGLAPEPRAMAFDPRPRVEAARRPMPSVPFLGVPSLPQNPPEALALESSLIASARKVEARPLGAGGAGLAPEDRATPHGFPVTLEGERWQSLVLGKSPDDVPDFKLFDMSEPAGRALSGNRTFLVATRFGDGLARLADRLKIAGWGFTSDIPQSGRIPSPEPPPKALPPTFLFKYHDKSVFDILGLDSETGKIKSGFSDENNWSEPEAFNANWQNVREQLREYIGQTAARHRELEAQQGSPYALFLERLKNPDWNGLLLLNAKVEPADLPLQVQGLLAGIDESFFRAHHVGLDLNQLGQEGFAIQRSSFFGVVDYPQPPSSNSPILDPEHDTNVEEATGEGKIANFRVEYLRIQFENSEVRRFDCRVNLWMSSLFRESLRGHDGGGDPHVITFDGTYERRRESGQLAETYSFALERDYVFDIGALMIDKLTIRRLQMTTVEANGQRVSSRFSFCGSLTFQKIAEDLDLFGIDKIDFSDLGIDLDFDLGSKLKKFLPRFGSLRFDLSAKGRRAGGFLGSLPFRLKFFQFGKGLSLPDLGYFRFQNSSFGGDLFDFALGFDIDLGSLGSLAKKLKGLRLETLFGWLPRNGGFAIGFKLQGTGGGSLDLGIEGVMKLVIEHLKVESFQHGGRKHFAIQAVNSRLEILGNRFPDKSKLNLFLFVDPARLVKGTVSEMGWLGVLTDSTGGSGFQLPLLALGQRINAYPKGGVPTTREVTEHIKSLGKLDDTDQLVSLLGGNALRFAPEREWTIALQTVLWELADLDLVFLDPDLYGIRLRVPGNGATPQLFAVDILYRKVSDDLGVYSLELAVPDAWRQIEFGAMSLTLPVIGLDIYTNGDFQVDVGFPWKMDFSRSCQVQMLPFLGGGGFYYAQLNSTSSRLVPTPRNPRFIYDPVVQLGLGVRVGVGKEFRKGILSAGVSISVFGILEGVWGQLRTTSKGTDNQLKPPSNYLVVAGSVGVIGEVFGHVDFGIVKAGISIRIWIAFGWVLETYQPLLLSVEAGVSVRVTVVIGRFRIFGREFKITISFSFSTRLHFEWTLGKGDLDRWNSLFLPKSVGLAAEADQPDLGPVRCLDWIEAPAVFPTRREIRLRFAPDITLVDGVPHTVALLTIDPVDLAVLGRALVLWAGSRWSVGAPPPDQGMVERSFSVHDLRHLEACLACPRSLAKGDSGPGATSFVPLDADALRQLFLSNLSFRVTRTEEVASGEEGPKLAVFPMLSQLSLEYAVDGGLPVTVALDQIQASPGYLDRLDREFDRLRVLLAERDRSAGLADEATRPLADFLLEDYCHILLRQTVDALAGEMTRITTGQDPTKVGASAPLSTLLDSLDRDETEITWQQIGEAISRFYLHGLRIPDPANGRNSALFAVAGVQRKVELGAGAEYSISVRESVAHGADWLSVDPQVSEKILLAQMHHLPKSVPAKLHSIEERSPVRPRENHYSLQNRSSWRMGTLQAGTFWTLPRALQERLRREEIALGIFEAEPGKLDSEPATNSLAVRWATRLVLRLQRLSEVQLAGNRPVYRLLPLGEEERRRLDRLVDAADWVRQTETRLVFSSDDSQNGVENDSISHPKTAVSLWRTDLSTEPRPEGASLVEATDDELVVRADLLENAADFLGLLRRASLVRSEGYFLAYRGGEQAHALNEDLPAHVFDEKGNGEISLYLLHPQVGPAAPVSAFADALLLGTDVGSATGGGAGAGRKIVYARAANPSQDQYHDLPFAQGTVGFRAYRLYPDRESATEAERAVAEQYHLLEYLIFDADGEPIQVLPVAPRKVGQNGPGEEPLQKPADLHPDDWSYEYILPAHKLLAGENASPYAAVGRSIPVDLHFRDPYGNRLADRTASINLPCYYIDRLLSPTAWPSIVATYDVSAERPNELRVQLRFDPRGFYADRSDKDPKSWKWLDPTTNDEAGRNAAERIADVLRYYATVREQLKDPNTELRLSTSLHAGDDFKLEAADRAGLISLVDEIRDFIGNLPRSGRALPTDLSQELPGRRWSRSVQVVPKTDDFIELQVALHLRRPEHLVHPKLRAGEVTAVPEATGVATPVEPALAAEYQSTGLVEFAERFEKAFAGKAVAVGTGSTSRRALWAVRASLVELSFTGEPAFFAVPPLSRRLQSAKLEISENPADPTSKKTPIRVTDFDLDRELREYFADVERFLQPAFVDRLLALGNGSGDSFEKVMRAKNELARAISQKLRDIYPGQSDTGRVDEATAQIMERMRADLREGYDIDTLVVVPCKVAGPFKPDSLSAGAVKRAPVAYGRLLDPLTEALELEQDAAKADPPQPSQAELRRLSLANLELSADDRRLTYLVFSLDSKREERLAVEPLNNVKYRLTHIERGIDDAPQNRDTAWLQLIRAKSFEIPAMKVPVPLRRFPELPTLDLHRGFADEPNAASFKNAIASARKWSYQVGFSHAFVDQDAAYLEVLYNVPIEVDREIQGQSGEAAASPELEALAAYRHHRFDLWLTFEQLLSDTADQHVAREKAARFAALAEKIAQSLAPQAGLAGDLEALREEYRIDDDPLDLNRPEGPHLLKIARTVDAVGGIYRAVPRKADGETYPVRELPDDAHLEQHVVSYQPEGMVQRYRPLVTLSQLDILRAESAWGGLFLRRNESFGDKAASQDFVYETPAVRFGESFTPTLDRGMPFVFDGERAALEPQIAEVLFAVVGEDSAPAKTEVEGKQNLLIDMRWSYESGRLAAALNRDPATFRSPHPIAIFPAIGINTRDQILQLAAKVAEQLGRWRAANQIVEGAHFAADIRVYGRSVQKPVLRLRRVIIPVSLIS